MPETPSRTATRRQAGIWKPDVAVVGLGLAGGMAALSAADEGARVIVFEKMESGGGCARASSAQLSGACSKLQLQAGIKDSPTLHYAEAMAIGEYANVSRILRVACENAGAMIDWLQEAGAPIYLSQQAAHEAYSIQRTCAVLRDKIVGPGGGGMNLFEAVYAELKKRVQRGDVRVLFNTSATQLVMKNGAVAGIKAATHEGKEIEYAVKAVIFACGGFAGNAKMVSEYNPHLKNVLVFPLLAQFANGDHMLMGQSVGAGVTRKGYATGYPGGIEDPEHPGLCAYIAGMKQYPGAVWLDKNGKRFTNENTASDTEKENAVISVPDCIVYVVLDRKIKEENPPIIEGNFTTPGLDWKQFEEEAARNRLVKSGATLEELAAKTGMDAATLKKTISSYNACVDAGHDPEFGRKELKYKLENPPFYAIRTAPRILSGMPGDGILVNEDMMALDSNGKVIPGLFAAGDSIGTAAVAGKHPVAGFALTPALIFGRIAGRNAARV